jgi:flagellar biosynthesis/type III secretory pathway M-ring protein FliF/YscJ
VPTPDAPTVPDLPSDPSTLKVVLLVIALALIVGAVAFFIRAAIRKRDAKQRERKAAAILDAELVHAIPVTDATPLK